MPLKCFQSATHECIGRGLVLPLTCISTFPRNYFRAGLANRVLPTVGTVQKIEREGVK